VGWGNGFLDGGERLGDASWTDFGVPAELLRLAVLGEAEAGGQGEL
jgi:hypothetical protein